MISLSLFQRLARGSAHYANITGHAPDWRRISKAIGGYMTGSFTADRLTRDQMIDWLDCYLGCRIVETTYGVVSWEGMIYEMRLVLDGVEYLRSLKPEWFHNRTKVAYTTAVGTKSSADWSENTDSSDEFGEMNYLVSIGNATSAAATALRDRHLKEFAWPRSRMVGTVEIGPAEANRENSLTVDCAGYWATLGWRYRTDKLADDNASTHISTLVGASEFVTTGRIETNTLSVRVKMANEQRLLDIIEDIIGQGDGDGNVWRGGVYAGRKFIYEQAPTTATYFLRDGLLVNMAGQPVVLSLVEPGFLLENSAAPMVWQPPGTSSAWDDPSVAYVEEVEFEAPDKLRLKLFGAEEGVTILDQRIRNRGRL